MKRISLRTALIAALVAAIFPVAAQANPGSEARSDYIIVFSDRGNPAAERAAITGLGGRIFFTYENVFNGVAVSLPEAALNGLKNRPGIELIEADAEVTTQATQDGATWGLDRIDQVGLPLDRKYNYVDGVDGSLAGGKRVNAYVIDTGIRALHVEFTGRMRTGYNAIRDKRGTEDCNGHGTHVAGTIGGSRYGVAKAVTLIPVRVLDCRGSGTITGVIAGVDWVAAQYKASPTPSVANMSLGGGSSPSLDTAVNKLISEGVVVVVAAGNSNVDACTSSPARVTAAITVGATGSNDARASFSNFGSCLDIFAPGVNITSSWHTSNSAINTISGTSMAAPHVAGVASLILSQNPSRTVGEVIIEMNARATTGVVGSLGTGSPNRLLYSLPKPN